MHYFAYGSNMSLRRIRARVPDATVLSTATLPGYRLAFHKIGRDGSGKCDVQAIPTEHAAVHGVVYRIREQDKPRLDAWEDLGRGYVERRVRVHLADGSSTEAFLYAAVLIDPALKPYPWYKAHVLYGAREAGLPDAYIAAIEAVDTVADPDPLRHARETAIYR